MIEPGVRPRALTIGLHPRTVDYNQSPGLDEAQLTARVAAANDALQHSEFDVTPCLVSASPDDAETEIRALLAGHRFDYVMIGGGVRFLPGNTALLERIVNAVIEVDPAIRFCFNTSPETTLDALRRAAASG